MTIALFIYHQHWIVHYSKHTSYKSAYDTADLILEDTKLTPTDIEVKLQRIK